MGDKKIYITAISCRPGHGDLIASDSKECLPRGRRLGRVFCCLWVRFLMIFFGILCRYLQSILRMQTNREKAGVAEVTVIMIRVSEIQYMQCFFMFFPRRVTQTAL